jgi:hypothetical protein
MRETISYLLLAASLLSGCTVGSETKALDPDVVDNSSATSFPGRAILVEPEPEPLEPWPDTFSRKQLGHSLIGVTEEYFARNYTDDCSWTPIRVSESEPEIAYELDQILEEFTNTFCDQLQLDPMMITGDYNFAKETLATTDRQTDEYGGVCGGSSSAGSSIGCALFHNAWIRDAGPEIMMGIAAHELFHIVQDSVNPGTPTWRRPPGDEYFIPMWFIEGTAVTYQAAMIHHLGLGDYSMYQGYSSMLLAHPETNIDMRLIEEGWSSDVYVVGHFATEYIIVNVGFEPMLDIITSVGEGSTFEEAFEMHVGMSLDSFYDKMSRIKMLKD